MGPLSIVVSAVYALLCIGLIVIILLQKKRSAGLGSMSGMGGNSSTYWDKNKSRSAEGKLELYTRICGVLFFALPLVISVIK